jgi:hypothetical protein
MSNPKYEVIERHEHHVIVRRTFDFTDPKCPAIPLHGGLRADDIASISEDLMMTMREAIELGLVS